MFVPHPLHDAVEYASLDALQGARARPPPPLFTGHAAYLAPQRTQNPPAAPPCSRATRLPRQAAQPRAAAAAAERIQANGYYGGTRLLMAIVHKYAEFWRGRGLPLPDRPFSLAYDTCIPKQARPGAASLNLA